MDAKSLVPAMWWRCLDYTDRPVSLSRTYLGYNMYKISDCREFIFLDRFCVFHSRIRRVIIFLSLSSGLGFCTLPALGLGLGRMWSSCPK